MELMEAIRKRFSARSYLDKPVEAEKLQRVMEAARLAPSASNRQEWRFVLIQDPQRRQAISEAAGQPFIGTAPVVIVACANDTDRIMRCGLACHPIDVAIALEHVALQATAEGLGTCWIGSFDQAGVKAIIGAPEGVEVVELMPLGYPATEAPPKNRLPLEEIGYEEAWRG